MIWLGLIVLLLYLLYRYATKNEHKWDGTGIKVLKPVFPLGGTYPKWVLTRDPPVIECFRQRYKSMKEYPYHVMYFFREDIVVIQDPEIIKDICIKSFDYFVDRVVYDSMVKTHPETRRLLLNLRGEEWKALRHTLSPTFTAGKLRNIVGGISACGPSFVDYIKSELKRNNGGPLKMTDILKRYTLGSIASGVYGLDAKPFEEEDSEFFREIKDSQVKVNLTLMFKYALLICFPKLCEWIGLRLVKKNTYFENLTKLAMQHRREHGSQHNDMLKLFIDLIDNADKKSRATNGTLKTEVDKNSVNDEQFEADAKLKGVTTEAVVDEETITQSATLFLTVGNDTTTNALSIVTYYLAVNPDVQDRVRQEIDDIAATVEDAKITYEEIKNLEYLDMVINESLRLSPVTPVVERVCTRDYKLPCGTVIPRETRVHFNAVGVHTDETYWEDPEEFRPERFSKENKHKIINGAYLPFGMGPRNCIGMRFALVTIKVGLYHLIRNFEVKPSDKTPVPVRYNKELGLAGIEGDNLLDLVPRDLS